MSTSGSIVRCTEFDSIRIEILTEGHGITIPAKTILTIDGLLTRCRRRTATLNLLPTVFSDQLQWGATYHETMPGEESRVILAHGSTPWAALVALADLVRMS